MIDGLKLTFSGEELRRLLQTQVERHEQRADWWARQQTRTPDDATEDSQLLPDHICGNEAERHAWRADVLAFIRDHLENGETYRLAPADLEFGELLPAKPEWLAQDEYEDQTRVGFTLERLTKAVDRLTGTTFGFLRSHTTPHADKDAATRSDAVGRSDELGPRRADLRDGLQTVLVESHRGA